jgi:hypothetical protein
MRGRAARNGFSVVRDDWNVGGGPAWGAEDRDIRIRMVTREDDVDAHVLDRRGWTISSVARILGHDRKTSRVVVTAARVPYLITRPTCSTALVHLGG